ncbi:MAG: hypothetical protein ACOYKM_04850 [Caulobacterales bacterium]|jgi:hypothetical protein
MDILFLLDRLHVIAAAALAGVGLWAAIGARPLLKRAMGVLLAQAGALVLLVSAVPSALGLAVASALLGGAGFIVALAIAVRLREAYGVSETDEIDSIDDLARPDEPSA